MKLIHECLAEKICRTVDNQSSYVQQLAWNAMLECGDTVEEQDIEAAVKELIAQNSSLFMQQIESLSSYQMNFLRAI